MFTQAFATSATSAILCLNVVAFCALGVIVVNIHNNWVPWAYFWHDMLLFSIVQTLRSTHFTRPISIRLCIGGIFERNKIIRCYFLRPSTGRFVVDSAVLWTDIHIFWCLFWWWNRLTITSIDRPLFFRPYEVDRQNNQAGGYDTLDYEFCVFTGHNLTLSYQVVFPFFFSFMPFASATITFCSVSVNLSKSTKPADRMFFRP